MTAIAIYAPFTCFAAIAIKVIAVITDLPGLAANHNPILFSPIGQLYHFPLLTTDNVLRSFVVIAIILMLVP
jgi:hypothetical protein